MALQTEPRQLNKFQAGDRVRLSKLGQSRVRTRSIFGTVVGAGSLRASSTSVRIRFDGMKTTRRLHFTYLEMIEGSVDSEAPRTDAGIAVNRGGPAAQCR